MNLYYVAGEEIILDKSGKPKLNADGTVKKVTDERAVPARDLNHLASICDSCYTNWCMLPKGGPFKMSDNW